MKVENIDLYLRVELDASCMSFSGLQLRCCVRVEIRKVVRYDSKNVFRRG